MITLGELLDLYVDANMKLNIYDLNDEVDKIVYSGYRDDMPDEYEDMEVSSIDNPYKDSYILTINIDTTEY